MPVLSGIDVRIVSDLGPLQEYQDPQEPVDKLQSAYRYIEVKDGMGFKIQVKLLAGFDFCAGNYVYWDVKMDDQVTRTATGFELSRVESGKILEEKERDMSFVQVFKPEIAYWENCAMEFGKLTVLEDLSNAEDPEAEEMTGEDAQDMGSIVVNVKRSSRYPAYVAPLSDWIEIHVINFAKVRDEVWKKAMTENRPKDDQYVDLNVKLVDGSPFLLEREDPVMHHYFYPLVGDSWFEYTFVFKYRSHKQLQLRDIIPRTPSPPVSIEQQLIEQKELLSEARHTIVRLACELDELRTQIARLQASARKKDYSRVEDPAGDAQVTKAELKRAKLGETEEDVLLNDE